MNAHTIYIPTPTKALTFAAQKLIQRGFLLVPSVSDAESILLPIPTPTNTDLSMFQGHTVIGGNLPNESKNMIDFLQDEQYLASNAEITAESALSLILSQLTDSFGDSPVLILGWGRIGKCLAAKLRLLDIPVSIYARKAKDQAMILALGYSLYNKKALPTYRSIVNTATAPILTENDISYVNPSCYLLELASQKYLPGDAVVHGRGLPGKYKPEASGNLIAETVARYCQRRL